MDIVTWGRSEICVNKNSYDRSAAIYKSRTISENSFDPGLYSASGLSYDQVRNTTEIIKTCRGVYDDATAGLQAFCESELTLDKKH